MTTDTPARWVFLAMLVAGGVTWLVWWLWWRRDDRAHHLAAGIADEQRTEAAGDPAVEILAVDPPVDRAYITGPLPQQCDGRSADGRRCTLAADHPALPVAPWPGLGITADGHIWESAPVPAGMVLYRGGAVHPECARGWLRDDVPPCTGCAVWLTDDLKASAT